MRYDPSRFNEANVAKAFAHFAADPMWDLVRYSLLTRYAEAKGFLRSSDVGMVQRAIGIMDAIEQVLAQFGEPVYGGLPFADGTPATEAGPAVAVANAEIGEGYPGGSGSLAPL